MKKAKPKKPEFKEDDVLLFINGDIAIVTKIDKGIIMVKHLDGESHFLRTTSEDLNKVKTNLGQSSQVLASYYLFSSIHRRLNKLNEV